MMKKLFFTFIVLIYVLSINAQQEQIKIEYGPEIKSDAVQFGSYKQYLGTNSEGIYTLFIYGASSDFRRICLHDKSTKKKKAAGEISAKDIDDTNLKAQVKGKEFLHAQVLDNSVHVFYEEFKGSVVTLYAFTFSADLKTHTPLKKIFERQNPVGKASTSSHFLVRANQDFHQNILVGFEKGNPGELATFEYLILNEQLEVVEKNETTLPYELTPVMIGGKYSILSNNNILHYWRKEEVLSNSKGKNNSAFCTSIQIIDASSGQKQLFEFKNKDEKVIVNPIFTDTKNALLIDATYFNLEDISKSEKEKTTKGLYHAEISLTNNSLTNETFSEFDDVTISEIYRADNIKRKKIVNEMAVQSIEVKDGFTYVICTKFSENTFKLSKNASQQVYKDYKGDIIILKLDKDRKVIWTNVIHREAPAFQFTPNDVHTIILDDKLLCIFDNDRYVNSEIHYSLIDLESGDGEASSISMHETINGKKNKKDITVGEYHKIENQLYAISSFYYNTFAMSIGEIKLKN